MYGRYVMYISYLVALIVNIFVYTGGEEASYITQLTTDSL